MVCRARASGAWRSAPGGRYVPKVPGAGQRHLGHCPHPH